MIHNQAGNQQSEINKNANDDNCLDNSELYGKREGIYSVAINKKQTRPAGLEPATFGSKSAANANNVHKKADSEKILLKSCFDDPILQRLVKVWPKFSPQGKHIIEQLIEMVE